MRITSNNPAKLIAKRRWLRRLNLFQLPEMGWVEFQGHRLFIDLADWKGPSYHVLNWGLGSYGTKEVELLRKCIKALKKTGPVTFLDVGANIGIFSFILSVEFNDLNVHAFEPNPMAVQCLRATFDKKLSNVQIHAFGLSNQAGRAKLYSDGPNHGGHSFDPNAIIEDGDEVTGETIVQTETLDRFAADLKVDLIKIDVQRHEAEMLAGAAKTIARDRPIILMECYFTDLLKADSPLLAPFKNHEYVLIEPHTYKVYDFDQKDLLRLKSERPEGPYCDLAFVPKEKKGILI